MAELSPIEAMREVEKKYSSLFQQPSGQIGVSGYWGWDDKQQWHFFFPGDTTLGVDGKPTAWSQMGTQPVLEVKRDYDNWWAVEAEAGYNPVDPGTLDIPDTVLTNNPSYIASVSISNSSPNPSLAGINPLLLILLLGGRIDPILMLLLMGGLNNSGGGFNLALGSLGGGGGGTSILDTASSVFKFGTGIDVPGIIAGFKRLFGG